MTFTQTCNRAKTLLHFGDYTVQEVAEETGLNFAQVRLIQAGKTPDKVTKQPGKGGRPPKPVETISLDELARLSPKERRKVRRRIDAKKRYWELKNAA